jgi:hypothetical protein
VFFEFVGIADIRASGQNPMPRRFGTTHREPAEPRRPLH